jgi:hypothetical protein
MPEMTDVQRAIAALKALTLGGIYNAPTEILLQFRDLTHHWSELAEERLKHHGATPAEHSPRYLASDRQSRDRHSKSARPSKRSFPKPLSDNH